VASHQKRLTEAFLKFDEGDAGAWPASLKLATRVMRPST
jgi:hypothetical protein